MSTDTSVKCRSICRPIYRSRGAPKGKGPYSPFSGHSHLLHLQWPLITKVIETPSPPFMSYTVNAHLLLLIVGIFKALALLARNCNINICGYLTDMTDSALILVEMSPLL